MPGAGVTSARFGGATLGVALVLIGARLEAGSDELTGCLNRRAGLARFVQGARAGAAHPRTGVGDLDILKQINDACGHLEGDRVLRETGARLRGQLRADDVVARYGVDEFGVVGPAADDHAAGYAAARMDAAVAGITAATSATGHLPVSVSVSMGAATSRPEESPESLLFCAASTTRCWPPSAAPAPTIARVTDRQTPNPRQRGDPVALRATARLSPVGRV